MSLRPAEAQRMRAFWDARSREDAFFFVDDTLEYGNPDLERFWKGGEQAVDLVTLLLGVSVRATDDVVDLGCGLGRLTRVLAARARHVHAMDISSEMLERAQRINPGLLNVDWIHGDGTTLRPLADGSADAVFSWVVFQHIPDPEVTLGYVREIGRVLRPGGWAAVGISDDPAVHRPRRLTERVRRTARSLAGAGPRGQDAPEWRGSSVGLDRMRATAEASGLRVERTAAEGTQFCAVLLRA